MAEQGHRLSQFEEAAVAVSGGLDLVRSARSKAGRAESPQHCPYCGAELNVKDIFSGVHDACDKPKEGAK